MVGWDLYNIAPGHTLADGSDIAAVSRIPGHMEIFYIAPNGSVIDHFWYGSWGRYVMAPAGAAAAGGIAFISRTPNHMEGWWTSPTGSVEAMYWYDDGKNWRYYQLSPPGYAVPGSKITAVSRSPDHMEVWWISPRGSIESCFWYDNGLGWQRHQLAPPGSADPRSGLTAVSREPKAIEVWWTGTDGSIQGSWMYDKIEWHRYQLPGAGPGSAVIGGGLKAQSRRSDVLHVWWVGPKGTLEGAYTGIDKTQWTRYQMAGQNSASLSTGICSLHRYSGTEEIYWIAPNGAMFNAYWYEDMPAWNMFQTLPGGSAKPNGKLMGVSRESGTMEIWYAASDGGVSDRYWYDGRTKTFGAPIISGGLAALGGWTSITLKELGSIRWNGDGHNSGADDYDYGVVGILRPRPGSAQAPITLVHSGHVEGGVLGTFRRDDPWDVTNDKDYVALLQQHYDDYANGTFSIAVQYTSGFESTFESLINTVVKWSVGSLLDGVGLLIFIGVEIGSLATTGSLVPGARILNGVLWMAGPGNTLLAVAAGGIASAGSRSKVISEEDYRWANNEVFNGTLPPRDRIRITDTTGKDGRPFTFPMSDGSITLNVGGVPGMFDNPQSNQPTLIHELVHAWQIHHTPFQLSLLADALASQLRGDASYNYPAAGPAFKDMNLEQQAKIVEDWWYGPDSTTHRRRGPMTGPAKDKNSTYYRYIRDNIQLGSY